jgi:hypothetical protein
MKQTLKLTIALMSLFVPISAAAYVPPDQYVYVDNYGLPPPTARHAQERVDAQNALYADRRQQQTGTSTYTTSYGNAVYPSVVSGSDLPGYVVSSPTHSVVDPNLGASLDDLIASVDDLSQTVSDLQGQINRPLRPQRSTAWVEPPAPVWQPALPSSGAGTWVILGVLGIAGIWTLRRARALEMA